MKSSQGSEPIYPVQTKPIDIDGDGKTSLWEANICRLCIMGALVLAFGKEALSYMS